MPGPLQVVAVSFGAGSDFQGRVLAEVDRLQGRGVIRLLDVLFVAKNEDGAIERMIVGDDEDFGALLARIVPLDDAGLADSAVGEGPSGFDVDVWALAASLPPGTALAFLLIEHRWARPLFGAIADAGGTLLSEGFLSSDAGSLIETEIAAMEEAAEVIAAAQAAEAHATLLAATAVSQAVEAIATSEAIRAAASAEAIRALLAAGLVEEAAAHEAVEAVNAAVLVAAAADEAAGRAVVEDASEVMVADEAAAEAVAADAVEVMAADEAAAEALAEAAAVVEAASITLGEARVLRYLPTRSTFAVIADKLGISRSAAKERAHRAYKKLGVHSRAEAVDRARALGLID